MQPSPPAHGAADDETSGGLSGMWIVEPDTPQLPLADDHAILIKYRLPYVATDNFYRTSTLSRSKACATRCRRRPRRPFRSIRSIRRPGRAGIPVSDGRGTALGACGSRSSVVLTVDHSDTPGTLTVPSGRPQLLRLLNATGDSSIYLRMRDESGAPTALHVVGLDGTPVGGDDARPLSQYVAMNEVILPPAGRADLWSR